MRLGPGMQVLRLDVPQVCRVGVARERGCLEGDALVVAGRKQEASLFHHLAQEERRSRVEIDDVGPPPSRPLEVDRERGQAGGNPTSVFLALRARLR